jgi:hypothetical protein
LSALLALDPKHPAAVEVSGQLNSYFRSRAEEARRLMNSAAGAADRAKATNVKPYSDALAFEREAETRFKNEQFAVATGKYLEARDGFERAQRLAEQVRPSLPPPSVLPLVQTAPPPSLTPPSLEVAPPTLAPQPPPTLPAAALDEPAVKRVIADYARAIESKDLVLFRSVNPGLSPDAEKRLKDAFRSVKSQGVAVTINSVRIDGNSATVRLTRRDTLDGKAMPPIEQTFTLTKGPGGWFIQKIGT